jgi:hypothetical protein
VRGLSGFLFPGGVQRRATLGMQSCGIPSTWPNHLNRLFFISVAIEWHLHSLYSLQAFIVEYFQTFLWPPAWGSG